jgi:uncharacterized membrane protein YeaQ/YmgE (transglycosylase-associated protein family)
VHAVGTTAIVALIFGALAVALIAQYMGQPRWGYEWAITAPAAAIGAFVASEYLGPLSAFGPTYDGMAVVPALVGGLVLTALAELAVRATGQPAA